MAHRRVLSPGQRRALFDLPADEISAKRWYILDERDLGLIRRRRKPENRLGYALQLCALRFPGRLLAPGEIIPAAMLRVVADQIGGDLIDIENYGLRENTRYEHSSALQHELGYRPFAGAARRSMQERLDAAAMYLVDGPALAKAFAEEFRDARIIVPAASTFERLCARALVAAEQRCIMRLNAHFDTRHLKGLLSLLEINDGGTLSRLAWLRAPVAGRGTGDLKGLVDRLGTLRSLDLPDAPADIPKIRLSRLAQECVQISAPHLSAMAPSRRIALLGAFAMDARTRLTDATLELGIRMTGALFKRAERRHLDALAENKRDIGAVIQSHAALGQALLEARKSDTDLAQAIAQGIGWDAIEVSTQQAANLAGPVSRDLLERIEAEHPRLRRFAPLLLETFDFRSDKRAVDLLAAIDLTRQRKVGADAPIGFVPKRWRRVIGEGQQFNAKVYEICVLAALKDALKAGNVWVHGAYRFRRFEDRLAAAGTDLPSHGASVDASSWLAERRERMATLLLEVECRAAAEDLPDAKIRDGRLTVSPLRNATPDGTRNLARRLYGLLPRIRITGLLEEVDTWTGFSDGFGHLRTNSPPNDRRLLHAAMIADGLNLGLMRMAEACDGATYWKLAQVADWHIRDSAYRAATDLLVEAQERLPIAALWGDGSTSSSDGQYFAASGRARAAATANLRYGTEPGVKFYTHVTDQFAPYATTAIAASAPEAPYVIDGLLRHGGQIPIKEHHTDTGRFTDHIFALCALLGFRFAPRIRDLADKRLYVFDDAQTTPTLAPMISRRIQTSRVEAYWPQIMAMIAATKSGQISAEYVVSTLSAAPGRNGIVAAMTELGRIERSIFMLEWMLSVDLRHRVQMSLNKGEARNNLARAVFIGRLGELRDRSHENHQLRAAGCNLITAAIVLWNTSYLQRAVDALRMAGETVSDELLPHVWPLSWDHIILTGDYRWSADNPKSPDELRPLRLERLKPKIAA